MASTPHRQHHVVKDSLPRGGFAYGPGYSIVWRATDLSSPQEGKEDELGVTIKEIIGVTLQRLRHVQGTAAKSDSIGMAINNLSAAISALTLAESSLRNPRKEEPCPSTPKTATSSSPATPVKRWS